MGAARPVPMWPTRSEAAASLHPHRHARPGLRPGLSVSADLRQSRFLVLWFGAVDWAPTVGQAQWL